MSDLALQSGAGEILRVDWPNGLKDASEVAMAMGLTAVADAIENARRIDIDEFEGMSSAMRHADNVEKLYAGEFAQGYKVGIDDVDDFYSVPMGYMTVLTGWPNDGKSQFLANILVNLATKHGLKAAIWAPEEGPESYITKLVEVKEGRPFFASHMVSRMSKAEIGAGMSWVDDNFVFLTQEHGQSASIESIIQRLDVAIRLRGCKIAVIDPYNYIDKPSGAENEVEWIRKLLISLKRWAQTRQCHLFLVAHPRQLPHGSARFPPTGFHISGGAPWNAITDFGLTVYRIDGSTSTARFTDSELHIWKCRQKWHGRRGVVSLEFDCATGRYYAAFSNEAMYADTAEANQED